MKTIGILGGLGPMASSYYYELIVKMTDACTDQEHPKTVFLSMTDTPDRTAYILGKSQENPLPYLIDGSRKLIAAGADFITIPCVTAQFFSRELSEALEKPVISLCEEVASAVADKDIACVGILATSGTIESGVLAAEFNNRGVRTIVPEAKDQEEVMNIIYNGIKCGREIDLESFLDVGENMKSRGAQKLILGCTELSLIKKDYRLSRDYVDVLDVLAQKAIILSGAKLKSLYKDIV